MKISQETIEIVKNAEKKLEKQYKDIDEIAFYNQEKVLNAFQNNSVQARHFYGSTGYGYDDAGRDTLCRLFAEIFDTEDAIVSPNFVSGTHAISVLLYGIMRPDEYFLSISGNLYDTIHDVIFGKNIGSLSDFNVGFDKVDLKNGQFDTPKIMAKIKNKQPKMVYIQRSRGYEWRDAISVDDMAKIIKTIKADYPNIIIAVDNCYGEFVDKIEPTTVGADLIVGSLIKNAGGGMAPTGAYIAGKNDLIKQISYRFTSASIGTEEGSYIAGYLPFYEGLFLAPHVVANAIKGGILMGQVYTDLGYETQPKPQEKCNDIIRSIKFDTEKELVEFCRAIQAASPVDSNVVPFPWEMPGYQDKVIMAAGAFVQGSSIELSADSPIKKPYIAYMQGGLTYEHVKIATMYTVDYLNKLKTND